jgi:hypothetical protein
MNDPRLEFLKFVRAAVAGSDYCVVAPAEKFSIHSASEVVDRLVMYVDSGDGKTLRVSVEVVP